MRAAIFNPYLDTLGGGERYCLTFARVLAEEGFNVDIEWKDKSIVKKLEDRFGMQLKNINIVADIKKGDGYDLCFWVSDGSIPMLKSRKNILHFQVPFKDVNGKTLLNKMKFFRINSVVVNSNFTKKIIDQEFGINSKVLYPPVPTDKIKSSRKENIILYVGRFSKLVQNKHQDILINNFKKFYDFGRQDWKLILAGGVEVGSDELVPELKKMCLGYPIQFVTSPNFKELKEIYAKSKFFWSASGFSVNESENPKEVEHFGITVVEAMASGSLPVIYNAGGHREIVTDQENGFLWNKESDLIAITNRLIRDLNLFKKISANSIKSAQRFSYENFKRKVLEIA